MQIMADKELIILDENTIKGMVYEIRGQKVMLDFDLARIYGYETKAFNQQVSNNSDRFEEDFRFQLYKKEWNPILRSKFLTANSLPSKRRYLPFAFAEQGIYMLMTVLKGDLATQQSKTLIRLFKAMKDALVETNGLLQNNNPYIENRFEAVERDIGEIKGQLGVIMSQFDDPTAKREFLILDGQRIEADAAYQSIYLKAKESIAVVDDYVSIKTLHLLKSCQKGVTITLLSDNVARPPLGQSDLDDFQADTGNPISMKPTQKRFHDRYVILDYGLETEMIYHCGASSKDSGKAITMIMRVEDPRIYRQVFESFLK